MSISLFVLSDGTEIFSGVGQIPAIKTVTYTSTAISSTDLDYAAACTASLEGTLIDTSGVFSVETGDSFDYYEVDNPGTEEESRVLIGTFVFEKPTKPSPNTYKFKAYDRMTLFDKDVTEWLTNLPDWPYTISRLLQLLCEECGVPLSGALQLINGEYPVERFMRQVTGRDLVRWVASANASFAFISPAGELSFSRFDFHNPVALQENVKKISASDYATAPISGVNIRQDEDDVGVSWPVNAEGELYVILGNPLLTTFSTEDLQPLEEMISAFLLGVSYMPAEIQYLCDTATLPCAIGQVLQTEDRNGKVYTTPVFNLKRSGSLVTVKGTGNVSRMSPTAIAEKDQTAILQGRVARMKVGLEEVSSELSLQQITLEAVSRETSQIVQTVDGISAKVESVETTVDDVSTSLSQVEQKADSLEITVGRVESSLDEKADRATVEEITEHFLFQEDGLTIFNSATGMGINVSEQQVAFTGGKDPTTVITPNQMETTKLVVGEQLDLGEFSFLPRSNGNLSFRYIGG